jgi:hypothetical protein
MGLHCCWYSGNMGERGQSVTFIFALLIAAQIADSHTFGTRSALTRDVVFNSAPAAAGVPGWVCTTPGAQGTFVFKAMAALAA